ncbi:hypothetical protein [Acinetobacter tandoii]|uniref:hypothetical protein n=1 Tax=Acinetobacter tandoii TaxID=202954 RepID=UPI0030170B97
MNLESLPLFSQVMRVLCSYRISEFQVSDIFGKVILLGVENNNINYQNVYRLVQRLVKEGYLVINTIKNPYTTYTETDGMMNLRDQFCIETNNTILELVKEQKQLELIILSLREEVDIYDELKRCYPDLQFKIEQLKQIKTREIRLIENKYNALSSLISYLEE